MVEVNCAIKEGLRALNLSSAVAAVIAASGAGSDGAGGDFNRGGVGTRT